jgi:hypothetical protein
LEKKREIMEQPPDTTKAVPAKPTKKKATRKPKPAAKKAKPAATKKRALKKSRKPKATLKHPESAHAKPAAIGNKAAFIRTFPKGTPAKEVIARAKARGAVLTESYIYNIRGMDKLKAKKSKFAKSTAYGKAAEAFVGAGASVFTVDHTSKYPARLASTPEAKPLTVEELFYAVVAEIGTRKAIHMLMAAHGVVQSALSGVPTALKG